MAPSDVVALVRRAAADGLSLTIVDDGLLVQGDAAARDRWRHALAPRKAEILDLLRDTPPSYARWTLHFVDTDPLTVTFAPAVSLEQVLAHRPDAVAAVPVTDQISRPPECATCRHRTPFGSCGMPVEAGLVDVFRLERHPDEGAECGAFEARPIAIEHRVVAVLAAGLIDSDDASLIRMGYQSDPDGWEQVLDGIERNEGRVG